MHFSLIKSFERCCTFAKMLFHQPFNTHGSEVDHRGQGCQHLDKLLHLAHPASLHLLGQDILGELQRKVDDEKEQLCYGQAAQEHTRVNIVSPEIMQRAIV